MGEHAVVYGYPALTTAVDLRLDVTLEPGSEPGVAVNLPQLDMAFDLDWQEIRDYTRRAREAWERYAANPSAEAFAEVGHGDPAHLTKIALGEAAGEVDAALKLRVDSGIPIGGGLGSSAAASVAIVGALRAWLGKAHDAATLDPLVLEVERRQHGMPSGVDHATVLLGGALWARRDGDALAARPLAIADRGILAGMRVYDTGRPAESTGQVVSTVRDRLRTLPDQGRELFERMGGATRTLRDRLTEGGDTREVVEAIRTFQRGLESLGVVPGELVEIVRRCEAEGGAAKITGAGTLTGSAAGCLLVYHPQSPGPWPFLERFQAHPVALGAPGLTLEIL
ncbi:hypothetical protein ABI59_20340 [Acidobacteria bacterium Mor1]|nr:hypothetical protein ABI59_20340 [Acidobacteria bacterium Mor1]